MEKLRSTSLGRAGSIETILLKFGGSSVYSGGQDLIMIRSLADTCDNRASSTLQSFTSQWDLFIAVSICFNRVGVMLIIPQGLNGSAILDVLPLELVLPSSRNLDTSVNFLKDILKNDNCSCSPSALDTPVSRLKERSFTSSTTLIQLGGRQDATVYKHEDIEPPGGFYQPRCCHVDPVLSNHVQTTLLPSHLTSPL